jgi:hypothetical protein
MDESENEACHGQNYVNVDATMAIYGHDTQKDLMLSPFVVYFELCNNINEGY